MTIDDAIATLSSSPDHRLLRRVPPVEQWTLPEPAGEVVRGCALDTETTGLGESDEVVELALVPFDYCKTTGRIVGVDTRNILSAFRQPSVPISEEAKKLTGITDEMVAGQAITDDQLAASLFGAQVVISHHSGFDRVMCEKNWKVFEQLCWACSYAEIDWRGEGVGSSKLDYITMRFGMFHDGHRALDDVMALLWILSGNLPTSGRPVLGALLEQARKPLWQVRAENTPIANRDTLKTRGYRWEPGGNGVPKAWVIATGDVEAEVAWLKASDAWSKKSRVVTRPLSPRLRYSNRVYSPVIKVAA